MFNQITKRTAKRRAEDERAKKVKVAVLDEMTRFMDKVVNGAKPIIQTAFGEYEVAGVTEDWWYITYPKGCQQRTHLNSRSFAGCNDGTWANLLRQVNEARSPLFHD